MSPGENQNLATKETEEEPPPVLGTWPRLYAAVLLGLFVEIVLFYVVTRLFS